MLYTIYDEEGRFHCEYHETQPPNSTIKIYNGDFIEPRYNVETEEFYEAATQEQKQSYVDALELDYQEKIHQLIWLHLEKKKMREVTGEQYEVPQEIVNAYNTLRQEYNTLKNEILNS
jgi:hypothetical protein